MPILCGPGDVAITNRQAVHGSFANTSAECRVTINFGFHPRASVIGARGNGIHAPGSEHIIYDEERRAFRNSEGGWWEELFVDDGYSVQAPPSLLGTHDDWRMCWKCKGLFYNGDSLGVCPDGGPHLLGNDNYALTPDAA